MSTPWGFDFPPPCAETDPETYFPAAAGATRAMRDVIAGTCGVCPGAQQCLAFALEHDGHVGGGLGYGVWGGTSPTTRARLRRAAQPRDSRPT